jgi:uncharacterized protein YkwD
VLIAVLFSGTAGILAAEESAGGSAAAGRPATETAWRAELYGELDIEDFLELPAANAEIDLEAVDYPLLHAAVFYLTNRERVRHGRTPLEHHPALEAAAQGHSIAMRDHGFFSHTSPLQGLTTVRDRVGAEGMQTRGVGENIAISFGIKYQPGRSIAVPSRNDGVFSYSYGGDPIPPHTYLSAAEDVVKQWMNSPGHRRNILRSSYRLLGVGAAHFKDSSFYGIDKFYFTQNFGL